MANQLEVDLIVKALSQGFDKISKDLGGVATAVDDGTEAAKKGTTGWTELASKISVAQQAYQAVAGVASKTYELIGEGAQLELSRQRFDNLTASIGTTADAMLTDLNAATGGMMSNADQIASASQIISLGLADNQKDVVDLASLVSQLGWDMQQVILTFANNSKARLDALGLSVTDVEGRMKKLEAQGYDTDRAFDLAVIEAGQAKLELLGSAADTTVGSMQRLEAQAKNTSDAFKEWLAGKWEGILGGLANTIDAGSDSLEYHATAWDKVVVAGAEFNKMMFGVQGVWGRAADNVRENVKAHEEYIARIQLTEEELNKLQPAIDEAASADKKFSQEAEYTIQKLYEQEQSIRAVNRILGEHSPILSQDTRAMEDAAYASGELGNQQERLTGYIEADKKAAQEQADAYAETTRAMKEAAAASGDYFASAIGGNNDLYDALTKTGDRTVFVSNLTGQQADDLSRMQTAYDKAAQTIRDYELGVKGANLTDEARNKKIEEQQALMATLSTNMQPLIDAGGQYVNVTDDGTAVTSALNGMLYDAADAAGASAETLALLAYATGDYSEEQLNAALQTAATTAKVQELAQQLADGEITVRQAQNALTEFAQTYQAEAIVDVQDDDFRETLRKLAAFDGKTYRATAEVTTTGTIPGGGAGTSGSVKTGGDKGGTKEYAMGTGGWQTVPGPIGAPFPATLHGGEMFNVVPAGQVASGVGGMQVGTVNIYAQPGQNGEQLYNEFMRKAAREARLKRT